MSVIPPSSQRHAVVIGGGITGLLAARVLAEHFARVTIVEREHVPESHAARSRVSHERHASGCLVRGEQLHSWFPDLIPALRGAGATAADLSLEIRWQHFGAWKANFISGIEVQMMSRSLLERLIADRVRAMRGVTVVDGCMVERLVASPDRARVTGVVMHHRIAERSEQLPADFVVDASGRGSRLPEWLESMGYRPAEESRISLDLAFASRVFRRPADDRPWKALFVVPRPPERRGACILPIEGNRWLATLIGYLGDHPPTTNSGWYEFARSLRTSEVSSALAAAEPLGSVVVEKLPSSLRRHYEKLTRFPAGLAVIGGAVYSPNPIHGQGLALTALAAKTLQVCFAECGAHGDGLSHAGLSFQRRLGELLEVPWHLAALEDLRHPAVEGARPRRAAVKQWYLGRLHAAAAKNREVALSFHRVAQCLEPPTALFRPAMAMRVLRAASTSPAREQREEARPEPELGRGCAA